MNCEELAALINQRTGLETKIVVLGYIQRGGSPTARDRLLSSQMGFRAIELFNANAGSRAVGIRGNHIVDFDLEEALALPKIWNHSLMELSDILS